MRWKKKNSILFIPRLLPGLNEIIAAAKVRKGSYSRYAELKSEVETEICLYIREQRLSLFECPVWLNFTWIEPNKRRDKDNVAAGGRKFILDSLVRDGVIRSDGWRYVVGWIDRFEIQKTKPGVFVEIKESE